MTTLAFTSAGSKIYIGTAAIPNDGSFAGDAAAFAAQTYVEIKEVTDIGAIGKTFGMVAHNPVGDPTTYKLKTVSNTGTLALKGARAPSDPGQAKLLAAVDSYLTYATKIVLQTGTILYVQGLYMGYTTTVGTVSVITSFDCNVELSGNLIVV